MNINFKDIGGSVFTGRKKGEALRTRFKLKISDNKNEEVNITISDDVYSVTSSFFLGMFGESIRFYGSKEEFLEHYHFDIPSRINKRFDNWIMRALRNKKGIF